MFIAYNNNNNITLFMLTVIYVIHLSKFFFFFLKRINMYSFVHDDGSTHPQMEGGIQNWSCAASIQIARANFTCKE